MATDPYVVKRDIAKETLRLAEKNGQLWAVGGIKEEPEGAYSVFSGYSKRAGAAILSYIIFWAKNKSIKKLFADTYEDNTSINQELREQGFMKTKQFRQSKYNSKKRVHRWSLKLQ